MKLYEINKAMLAVIESADPLTGEINAQLFNDLSLEKEEKQKNVVLFCHQLEADTETIDREIERLTSIKKKTINTREWMLSYLKQSMELDGINELDFTTFKAKIKKNPPKLVIDDESIIGDTFYKTEIVKKLDKEAVKTALRLNSELIAGCHIEQGTRLEIK